MAYLYGSGNDTVDRMTNFGITGNVIPHAWYKTIVKDNGRPHLLAIELLADIVYWYRPQEIRDEHTGHLLRYQKKFFGDMLQKSYEQYATFFGEKKRIKETASDSGNGFRETSQHHVFGSGRRQAVRFDLSRGDSGCG